MSLQLAIWQLFCDLPEGFERIEEGFDGMSYGKHEYSVIFKHGNIYYEGRFYAPFKDEEVLINCREVVPVEKTVVEYVRKEE